MKNSGTPGVVTTGPAKPDASTIISGGVILAAIAASIVLNHNYYDNEAGSLYGHVIVVSVAIALFLTICFVVYTCLCDKDIPLWAETVCYAAWGIAATTAAYSLWSDCLDTATTPAVLMVALCKAIAFSISLFAVWRILSHQLRSSDSPQSSVSEKKVAVLAVVSVVAAIVAAFFQGYNRYIQMYGYNTLKAFTTIICLFTVISITDATIRFLLADMYNTRPIVAVRLAAYSVSNYLAMSFCFASIRSGNEIFMNCGAVLPVIPGLTGIMVILAFCGILKIEADK